MQLRNPYRVLLPSFIAIFAFGPSSYAQIAIPLTGKINTIAGIGTAGYSGNSGAATSAKLNQPASVAVDASGNVYIADATNNVIRKITASTGIITTVAGTGTAGYTGDGGLATSAELSGPKAVAVDSSANIYIADTTNNRIRKVTVSTGDISTVAGDGTKGYYGDGGAATSAEINLPAGVAVDSANNIYVSDTSNHRVRLVTIATGSITTLVGNGVAGNTGDGGKGTSAELNSPHGIAVSGTGSNLGLYIADTNNNRVRIYLGVTADIQPLVGSGTKGYSGDGGPGTSAELNLPTGVARDPSQNIYIADAGNNRIRELNGSTSNISTVVGNGTAGYSGDAGVATSAELSNPSGLAIDAFSNIYIADTANNRVRLVGESTPVYVSCSPNPAPFGNGTTCTATIEGKSPTGTVEWEYNSTVWQTDTLSGSTDSITGLSTQQGGTYTINAIYSGDSSQPAGTGTTSLVITAALHNTQSYIGPWQPPTIGQSNTVYQETAAFSGGPADAQITTIQWQMEWSPGNGIPPGMEMAICDAAGTCTIITNPTSSGSTSKFAGESPNQTFTFQFEIPSSQNTVYNPPYTGISTNGFVEANYEY